MANRSYRRLYASTEGNRYDGSIMAEFIEADAEGVLRPKTERVWRCGHAHEEWEEAEQCAQAQLASMVKGK